MSDLVQLVCELVRPIEPGSFVSKIESFERDFLSWNQRINLSAARDAAAIREHVLDCVRVAEWIRPGDRVVDVGAGGGLPGLIIAILRPEAAVTSLEPVHKKVAFMRSAARTVGATNHRSIAERSEVHAVRDYDLAVSRATMDLREWLRHGDSLVRRGGLVVGFEGSSLLELVANETRHQYRADTKTRSYILRQA